MSSAESVFVREGATFTPTVHARGPWDPRAFHGGAPAALMARAFEAVEPSSGLLIARLSFEFLRPVPLAPLTLTTRIVRPGRRVQELAGELRAAGRRAGRPSAAGLSAPAGKQESTRADGRNGIGAGEEGEEGDELVCRATALRVQAIPEELPDDLASGEHEHPLGSPDELEPTAFSLDGSREESFAASAMEIRPLDDMFAPGPARVWMHLRRPLVAGEAHTPLSRLVASADFGNGVSATLPFERYLFINADLSLHLERSPRGEWIGLDSRTFLHPGGIGLAESVLYDLEGRVGRAFQTLVVEAR